jgi:hypothetical protein
LSDKFSPARAAARRWQTRSAQPDYARSRRLARSNKALQIDRNLLVEQIHLLKKNLAVLEVLINEEF